MEVTSGGSASTADMLIRTKVIPFESDDQSTNEDVCQYRSSECKVDYQRGSYLVEVERPTFWRFLLPNCMHDPERGS